MNILQRQPLVMLLADLTMWQCVKWILTVFMVCYLLKEYVFKGKQTLSPEQRAKRRYMLANMDVMRVMRDKERQQFEQTLQNTMKNVKILACEGQRKKNLARRKVVVISQEKNIYYDHTQFGSAYAENPIWSVTRTTSITQIVQFETQNQYANRDFPKLHETNEGQIGMAFQTEYSHETAATQSDALKCNN